MGSYFFGRQMAPFGPHSILTVDLGQQYVDFFAYYRQALLHDPSSLLFSWQKGLGGEMWGTNAYYLLSPLNLILLAFPGRSLSSGILILTLLKYGLASFSMHALLTRQHLQGPGRALAFSIPYAMSGWMIANQLNLLWLDVLWLLPFVIDGLLTLLNTGRQRPYWLALTATIIINYYMAYMVALFTIGFVGWQLALVKQPWRQRWKRFSHYVVTSLLAVTTSAVILLPTVYALAISKGTYHATNWHWRLEYPPLKLIGKLMPGTFNFDQMPTGQPNFYVGMLMLMGALLYLKRSHDRWSAKLIAAGWLIFLIASCVIVPLDLIWHLGQFPVWYPDRFSFLISFWLVWLAARTLQPGLRLSWTDLAGLFLGLSILTAVCLSPLANSLTYLKPAFIWAGYLFGLASLIALILTDPQFKGFFVLVAIADATFNATLTLNNLSYISQSDFANYTHALQTTSRQQHQLDPTWYRVAKSVSRTKDDPMQANINSGDEFSSTLPPQMAKLMTHLGQPAGDGVISYISGTSVTDSLLGMKYLWLAPISNDWATSVSLPRPDWLHQPHAFTAAFNVKRNPWALPLGFGATDDLLTQPLAKLDPIRYQEQLYQRLAGTNASFFQVADFKQVNFKNLPATNQITGSMLVKQDPHRAATMTLTVQPHRGQSSYLTLGNQILEHAEIRVNGQRYDLPNSSLGTIILNVAGPNETKPVKITVTLKNESLWLQNMSLYQLDQVKFRQAAQKLQQAPWRLTHATSNYLSGSVKLTAHQSMLMTTIPATPGWHVFVDGHPKSLVKVANAFWAVKLPDQQRHQVTMLFIPPLLGWGILVTIVSLWIARRYLKP